MSHARCRLVVSPQWPVVGDPRTADSGHLCRLEHEVHVGRRHGTRYPPGAQHAAESWAADSGQQLQEEWVQARIHDTIGYGQWPTAQNIKRLQDDTTVASYASRPCTWTSRPWALADQVDALTES